MLCFPHAGGSASYYTKWKTQFDNTIDFIVVQYPMREKKFTVPMPDTIAQLADQLYEEYRFFFQQDFIIWGHSMGSVVGYEVVKRILAYEKKAPMIFFASGASAPLEMKKTALESNLSDESLIISLMKYGGIDQAILELPEFRELYLPIIRKDMALLEQYQDLDPVRLPCPISILKGESDPVKIDHWNQYSEYSLDMNEYPGGHFFINQWIEKISDDMKKKIAAIKMN